MRINGLPSNGCFVAGLFEDTSQYDYRGLYPRSWTSYDIPELKLMVVLRQISPVFPNDYRVSCNGFDMLKILCDEWLCGILS